MRRSANRVLLLLLTGLLGITAPATAQCTPQWLVGDGYPGVYGQVNAMTRWDPDGPGPAAEALVLGGQFSAAGDCDCNNIVLYTPTTGTWTPLGIGISGTVNALATLANGDLAVGGNFSVAGGVQAHRIARWNGVSWSPIGATFDQEVLALATLPNGDLVAGGSFAAVGSVVTLRAARWDGASWSDVGGGVSWPSGTPSVRSLAVLPNGDLVAGGWFTQAGAIPAVGIARWNGTVWSPIGGGMNSAVLTLLVRANGDLIAGGPFGTAGGLPATSIARWNGATWSSLGTGIRLGAAPGQPRALAELPSGALIAAGFFDLAGGVPARNIAAWDGTTWSSLGAGIENGPLGPAALTALPSGDLVVGGWFRAAGDSGVRNVALWNGSIWQPLARGADDAIQCMASTPNGDLVVGGLFRTIGGLPVQGIVRRSGATWSALGTGLAGEVRCVGVRQNGEIFAGGDYRAPGGPTVSCVMRWDGTAWSVPGTGLFGDPTCVAVLPNGDVVLGGFLFLPGTSGTSFGTWQWDGSSWTPFGAITTSSVAALHLSPSGELFAAGNLELGGSPIPYPVARWTGTAWVAVGPSSNSSGYALTSLPDGSLIAALPFYGGGGFPTALVGRWNGTSWQPLPGLLVAGNSVVRALATLPNGDLVAGGLIGPGPGSQSLMRWNGAAWSPLGPALDDAATVLHKLPDGRLLVGGPLLRAGARVTPHFAELATPCPATVVDTGGGCGTNTLTAASLPWVGSTFRANGTGLPSSAVVAVVSGFSAVALPLSTLLPPGVAGCNLLVAPDFIDAASATAGSVATAITIPKQLSLVGLGFRQQLVPFVLDAAGNVLAATSSNALTMTLGAF
ncbi:MAG: hypothetical protein MUC36_14360 [Planctomycetes bacterium]|jgi:hypothetical protein|nr:hypothetical protein [Planctomycetota bacterium]